MLFTADEFSDILTDVICSILYSRKKGYDECGKSAGGVNRMNIKQASEFTGISKDMIRFYEKKGIIHPTLLENGYREYSPHDLLLLVTARQYNCLGMELDKIAGLMRKNDPDCFRAEMSSAVKRLQEEQEWLAQRVNYAHHMENIFRMASEHIDHEEFSHVSFYFYPRTEFEPFANLYAYNSARPVFRIRNENIAQDAYPVEQGMLFTKRVDTDLPFTVYKPGTIVRFVRVLPPNTDINGSLIHPLIRNLEAENYEVSGDIFVSLIMGDAEHQTNDLASIEIQVQK